MKNGTRASLKIVTLAILLVCMVLPGMVRAVNYTVGVKTGEWIKYGHYTVAWSGNGTEPSYVVDESKMGWEKVEVEGTNGTTVNFNLTIHYNNGTQTTESMEPADVLKNSYGASSFFIASNLTKGDFLIGPIPDVPSWFSDSARELGGKINETVTGLYAGAIRDVDLINLTWSNNGFQSEIAVYWDRNTGVLVQEQARLSEAMDAFSTNPGAYTEISMIATETNMWSPDLLGTLSSNLIYVVAGIIGILAVITLFLFLMALKFR